MESTHNWPVQGHDWAIDFLRLTLRNQRNRHAYLITGTNNIGKNQLAHAFAMALNCTHADPEQRPCGQCRSCRLIYSNNHPDIVYAQRDEKTGALKIDAIREVMRLLALKPFDSRYRIAIFDAFDQAQPRAQDALLKTLEEPPGHAVLILLAQSTETLMPTITSRCQIIPLKPVPQAIVKDFLMMHGADDDRATLLARLSSGRMGWAFDALKNDTVMQERDDMLNMLVRVLKGNRNERFAIAEELDTLAKKDKQAIRYLLEMWQTYWRDVVLQAQQSPIKPCNTDRHIEIQQLLQRITAEQALTGLNSTRKMLNTTLKTNASVRLAFEVLFLDYPGL